jgi:hypothetical protein
LAVTAQLEASQERQSTISQLTVPAVADENFCVPAAMGGLLENTVLHPLHEVQFATHAKLKFDDYYHNCAAG